MRLRDIRLWDMRLGDMRLGDLISLALGGFDALQAEPRRLADT